MFARFRLILFALLPLVAGPLAAAGAPAEFPTGQLLRDVLGLVQREHVDAGQFSPRALLEGALQHAAESFPEMDYTLRFQSGRFWLELRGGGRAIQLAGPQPSTFSGLQPLLVRTVEFLEENLLPRPPPGRVVPALVEGLLARMDERSRFLDPEQYTRFRESVEGNSRGVGLVLHREDGVLAVRAVLPTSPAARAGIARGSLLELIDFAATRPLSVPAAERLLLGEVGSAVTVHLRARAGAELKRTRLIRRAVALQSTGSHLFAEAGERWVGYLRITEFQSATSKELASHLNRIHPDRPGFLGFILDLRANPGGVMQEAIRTADRFLDRGGIVTLRGRGEPQRVRARGYGGVTTAPVIVLVDQNTASGAELLAAALAANRRALVIGARTVGKGTVQSVIPISAGYAVTLTVARLFTPAGHPIQTAGVRPDVALEPVRIGEGSRAIHFGGHRAASRGPTPAPLARLPYLQAGARPGEPLPRDARRRQRFLRSDFPVRLARQILLFNQGGDYPALVRNALEVVRAEKTREQGRIGGALARLGVDWREGPAARGGRAAITEVLLEVKSGRRGRWRPAKRGLKGSRARVTLTVRNGGSTPLYQLLGRLRGDSDFFGEQDMPIGYLPPGQTRSWRREIPLHPDLAGGIRRLRAELADQNGRVLHRASLVLTVPPPDPPVFRLRAALSPPGRAPGAPTRARGREPNRRELGRGERGRGVLRSRAPVEARVEVTNVGRGASGPIQLILWPPPGRRNAGPGAGPGPILSPVLAPLAPGASHTVRLAGDWGPGGQHRLPPTLKIYDRHHPGAGLRARLAAAGAALRGTVWQKPAIELEPLRILADGSLLDLAGRVLSQGLAGSVTVRLNGRRVLHRVKGKARPGDGGSTPIPFRLAAHLRDGRNEIVITTRDGRELETKQRLILWRDARRELAGDRWFQVLR
ncbi:MAG: S41 family peptidase [bacterium]